MPVFTTDGTENRMMWDRRSAGFTEAWYVTLNHEPSGAGIWLRYTITSPRSRTEPPVCELWAFLFDRDKGPVFAAKNRHSIDLLGGPNGRDDGALVRIGDAWLSETHMEGEVSDEGSSMSWSLDIEPAVRCFHHIPSRLRRRAERRFTLVCAPNLSVPFTGTVKLEGQLYEFTGEVGQQGHRWGRAHAPSWAWAHCSDFGSGGDAVFEALGARSSIGPIPVPTMHLIYLRHDGEDMTFNQFEWALRARGRYEMPTWAFSARNDYWRIAGAARTGVDRMVQVTYMDPDGSKRFCANSEVADLGIEIYRRSGAAWLHHASLTSLRKAHLEFGRRDSFVELPVSL